MHGGALNGEDARAGVDLADRDGLCPDDGRGANQGAEESPGPEPHGPKSQVGNQSAIWGKKMTIKSPITWRTMNCIIPA